MTKEVRYDEVTLRVDFLKLPQFVGRSVEDGKPVTLPLDNLEELLAWKPQDPHDHGQSFSIAHEPFVPKLSSKGDPKVLVCHDMMNGYLNDRFVQGVTENDVSGYHVIAWNAIDIFVYFSHHFVTIPPVGWVNAGHRNGTAILGTFIMEGDAGYKICDKILSSKFMWELVAQQLVRLAAFYGFDGWLLNVENNVVATKVPSLAAFIRFLTAEMHKARPTSFVIWYDSVTADGVLAWQNELNKANQIFYKSCDGIFLNYGWNEKNLKTSKANATSPDTVYVGIDVFGRGCYGGGGFNCAAALSLIRREDLSTALFAPGWVYEELGCKNFNKNNAAFWDALQPLTSPGAFNDTNGFSTTFNSGFSTKGDWYHLDAQEMMPVLPCDYFSVVDDELGRNCQLKIDPVVGAHPLFRKFDLVGEAAKPFQTLLLLFKLDLSAPGGKVFVRVEANQSCVLVLKTSIGLCQIFPSKHWFSKTPGFAATEVGRYSCVSNARPFTIEGLYVETFGDEQDSQYVRSVCLSTNNKVPSDAAEESVIKPLSLQCDEVEWKHNKDTKDSFLFSCTLVTDYSEKTFFIEVQYLFGKGLPSSINKKTSGGNDPQPQLTLLGRSYTSRYRVHDLPVPNPKYHGPDCFVWFVGRHVSKCGDVLQESKLKVNYAENI